MAITINVIGQKMIIAEHNKILAPGSQEFVKFEFNLSDDWDGLTVFAQFRQGTNAYNQYLDNDKCAYLPTEIGVGNCMLMLYGTSSTGTNVIGTTRCVVFKVEDNRFISDASSTEISQTLYDQLVALVRASTGSPLVASTASAMTDTSKIYVYTGNQSGYSYGYWYYYTGSAWAVGGPYNSSAVNTDSTLSVSGTPADAAAVGAALADVQNMLTFDSAPTSGSSNPVTSAGVFTALAGKQDNLTFDSSPTNGSTNPVTSGGIYTAIGKLELVAQNGSLYLARDGVIISDSAIDIEQDLLDGVELGTNGFASYTYVEDEDAGIGTLTFYDSDGNQMGDAAQISIGGTGGGGGGGSGYRVRLQNTTSGGSSFTTAAGLATSVSAIYTETYDGDSTGSAGTLTVQYKLATASDWTTFITNRSVTNGTAFSIDVTDILTTGSTTNIKLTVVGGESGSSATSTISITTQDVLITSVTFDQEEVYSGSTQSFTVVHTGRDVYRKLHVAIDGTDVHVGTGVSSRATTETVTLSLGSLSYGAHKLSVYLTLNDPTDQSVIATTRAYTYVLMYDDGTYEGSTPEPIVGIVLTDANGYEVDEITYYDTLYVNYIVGMPNATAGTVSSATLTIYTQDTSTPPVATTYHTQVLSNFPYNVVRTWTTTPTAANQTYPESGDAYVKMVVSGQSDIAEFSVNEYESDFDLDPVTTSLVYSFSASDHSNNDSDKTEFTYEYTDRAGTTTDIVTSLDNFNWVSNGYFTETGDTEQCLKINGDATVSIELPVFSTSYVDDNNQTIWLASTSQASVATDGRTIEIEYEVDNITDLQASIINCMSTNHSGFNVTPQNCWLTYSNGANVVLDSTGFIENETSVACAYLRDGYRTRLSFVIQPLGAISKQRDDGVTVSSQCVYVYINGEYASAYIYPSTASFAQSEFITIGSPTCVTKLYDVKIYNRGLTREEIEQNYRSSPIAITEKETRFVDNDVLDANGDIDYEACRSKYPCILLTGDLSTVKSFKVNSGIILTLPDGDGGYTTALNLMDKDGDGNYVSQNAVQGTTSQKFPVKNQKVYLRSYKSDTGETKKVKYSLKGYDSEGVAISIPESTLCWKADYMSSDHANTFNANLADEILKAVDTAANEIPESQTIDARCQNTVYGIRCLMFYRESESDSIRLVGDGCLNNDKGNTATFGLEYSGDFTYKGTTYSGDTGNVSKRQKWEFLNNTEPICSFQTDAFQHIGTNGKADVLAALESCYPDQGDLEDEGLEPIYDHIQVLFAWVCQRANFWDAATTAGSGGTYNGTSYSTERALKKAIFLNEFEDHFNMNHALVYYLFCEFTGMTDNRAKNMFMRCEDVTAENIVFTSSSTTSIADLIDSNGNFNAAGINWEQSTFAVWMPDLYDLDSCFGVENSGYLQVPYYADWDYQLNDSYKFNGYGSRLWLMVEEALHDEIEAMAQQITAYSVGSGALNYAALRQYHITDNADLVCEAVIDQDMETKYRDPWTDGYIDASSGTPTVKYTSDYMYLTRGGRTQQKDAFIYRRCQLLYSKYACNAVTARSGDTINFRVGSGAAATTTAASAVATIKASQVFYPIVRFADTGNLTRGSRTAANTAVTLSKGSTVGYSDTVYICSGSIITDIGDISNFMPYEIQLANAVSLKSLTIGSSGSTNTALQSLDTSACQLLETINIRNCTALTGEVDLSKNTLIKEIYAAGCGSSNINLPEGGVVETLELGPVSTLWVVDQANLETFSINASGGSNNYNSITSLRIENTPVIDTLAIVTARLNSLTSLRLVGINWTVSGTSILEALVSDAARGKYIDGEGVISENPNTYPYISGTVTVQGNIGSILLSELNEIYPDLTINYTGTVVQQYYATFMNADGTAIKDLTGANYVQLVNAGSAPYDPVTAGEVNTPTLAATAQYYYTYTGWDNITSAMTGSRTITAQYSSTLRTYTVSWYKDSNVLLRTVTGVPYGGCVDYAPTSVIVAYGTSAPASAGYPAASYSGKYYQNSSTGVIYYSNGSSWTASLYDGFFEPPTYTDYESTYTYNVFRGWDNSTGFITGDTIATAVWVTTSGIPPTVGTDMSDMSEADIYCVCKDSRLDQSDYFTDLDHTDITLGGDCVFDNVDSVTIGPKYYSDSTESTLTLTGIDADTYMTGGYYFDGSSHYVSNISLFDEDSPAFTMAIDFDFVGNTADCTLVSANYGNTANFRLYHNGTAPMVQWGDQTVYVGTNGYRDIVVLRHPKGSSVLYVYAASNNSTGGTFSTSVTKSTLTRTTYTYTEEPLTFGAVNYHTASNAFRNMATGHIHWMKIWYDDIGESNAYMIAHWPHETIRMEYWGEGKYELSDGSGDFSYASFIANNLLAGRGYPMNTSNTNVGGWDESRMRTFCNGRLFNALPTTWKSIIREVKINATEGNQSTTIVTSNDKVYLPSYKELGGSGTGYDNEIGTSSACISWFVAQAASSTVSSYNTANAQRLKWRGRIRKYALGTGNTTAYDGNAYIYSCASDPAAYLSTDIGTGSIWINTGNSSIGYMFVEQDELDQYGITPAYTSDSGTFGDDGASGGWVNANGWWERSPNLGYTTNFMYVNGNGGLNYSAAGFVYGVCPGFSI